MTEDIFASKKEDSKNSLSLWSYSVIFVLLLLFAAFLYVLFYQTETLQNSNSEKVYNINSLADANNPSNSNLSSSANYRDYKFFFTGKDLGSKYIETLGLYDIKTESLRKVSKPDFSSVIEFAADYPAAIAVIVKKEDLDKNQSIYKAADFYLDKNFYQDYSLKDAKKIEVKKKIYHYKNLDFSFENSKLLFNALEKAYKKNKPYHADEWGIYVLDIKSGKIEKIANGLYPHWIDENRIVYLEKNGLKVLNLQNGESYYLRKLPYRAEAYLYFDLNIKKRIAVWSFPKFNQLLVMQVSSMDPFALKDKKLLNLPSASVRAKISDDAKYLIFLSPSDYNKFKVNNYSTDVRLYVMGLDKNYKMQKLNFDMSNFDIVKFKILGFWR